MSHADTLRSMADGQPIPWDTPVVVALDTRQDALLAGANALDTLDRVRDAVTEIDRIGDDVFALWEQDAYTYDQGRSDAYYHARIIITEALGEEQS